MTPEEFLASLEDYTPTIPDELTEDCLARSGFNCPDKRMTRLISLAAQKFIGEIVSDSLQYCRVRQSNVGKDKSHRIQEKRLVLTTEDLSLALKEYGVNVARAEYFVDGGGPPGDSSVAKDSLQKK